MLEKIKSPADLRELPKESLPVLAGEIREKIIDAVAKNGGHLASNLGAVELTLAVHRVFDTPRDTVIFDVGHQCYAHKLLTGRQEQFPTIRRQGSVSGFTNRDESEYDAVTAGHSGPSVSEALGIARAKRARGDGSYTVVVAGDGSFSNGVFFEALNNCSERGLRLIIVLNDNGMLISEAVGGFSGYLSRIRTSESYFAFKCALKRFFLKIPLVGGALVRGSRRVKEAVKRLFLNTNMFESLGLEYLGPVDGNDVYKMTSVLEEAKTRDEVVIVHAKTVKGLGYAPAERVPESYHSVGAFDPALGAGVGGESFSTHAGDAILRLGEEDASVCAVTAAMPEGTGLSAFAERFPDRFFDVGIAEEHAAAFSGGLAIGGMKPFCAVYCTFAQRIYDQVFHDAALQRAPVTFLLSHAGLVAGDGATHQGIFDVALLSSVPGIRILCPDSYGELEEMIRGDPGDGPRVIRYPKGAQPDYPREEFEEIRPGVHVSGAGSETVIVTYGRTAAAVYGAAKSLAPGASVGAVRFSSIVPLDAEALCEAVKGAKKVLFVEEGIKRGGFSETAAATLAQAGFDGTVSIHAIEDEFPPHGDLPYLLDKYGFTKEKIADLVLSMK